jgi:hypothetical protein
VAEDATLGTALLPLGDDDGDGRHDLLLGSPGESGAATASGKLYRAGWY